MRFRLALLAAAVAGAVAAPSQTVGGREDWIQLFNGRDMAGWLPMVTGH
jgi:hypothetical protein